MKCDNDNSAYSSSGGRSSSLYPRQTGKQTLVQHTETHPSKMFFADVSPPFVLPDFVDSPSEDTLNKSSTSPVFIEPSPAFCCVTTELAISNLKRCSLIKGYSLIPLETATSIHYVPHDLFFQSPPCDKSININHLLLT